MEARPIVQVIYVLRFITGYVLTNPAHVMEPPLLVAAVSWWLAVVAVYAFNGITDYAEDSANGSLRPIASGALGRGAASVTCAAAGATSLALATQIGSLWPWLAGYIALGVLYSARPFPAKNRTETAGAVVFGLGFCSYGAGAALAHGPLSATGFVFAVVASCWMATAGTVLKDLSDVEGDAAGGRRTLAVRFGRQAALLVGVGGALLVGVGGCAAAVLIAPHALGGTIPFALGALVLVKGFALASKASATDRQRQRGSYRVFMRTQFAANITILAISLAAAR